MTTGKSWFLLMLCKICLQFISSVPTLSNSALELFYVNFGFWIKSCHLCSKISFLPNHTTVQQCDGKKSRFSKFKCSKPYDTITYKSRLTPKKLYKKPMLFLASMGETGWTHNMFFLIFTWAFRGCWGRRRPPSEGGRFWGWKFFFTKTKKLAFQLCFPCYGIFPTRNALKLTFVFFQFQLLAPAMCYIIPI